jgi:hypothetical protein
MIIETKLEQKEFIKVMFILTYRKPLYILFTSLGFLPLLIPAFYFHEGAILPMSDIIVQLICSSYFFVFLPITIYYNARKNFSTNVRIQEKITYEISESKIKCTGETFTSERTWEKLHKILELNNWIILYESRSTGSFIPKEAFGDRLTEFKDLVRSKPFIKQKLK